MNQELSIMQQIYKAVDELDRNNNLSPINKKMLGIAERNLSCILWNLKQQEKLETTMTENIDRY